MANIRRLPARLGTFCVLSFAVSRLCAQEYFPGNIFESRPPHVRISEPNESPANPRGGQWFGYTEPPPEIPPQSAVRLTENDLLSIVYPARGGSFHSGGFSLFDRLRFVGSQFELDLFRFYDPFGAFGATLVPPRENSIFMGQLSAGGYTVKIRNWWLPSNPNFDPETFEPPSNAIMPTGQIFATPTRSDDPPVYVESSFSFAVQPLPEGSTIAMTIYALIVALASVRRRPHEK